MSLVEYRESLGYVWVLARQFDRFAEARSRNMRMSRSHDYCLVGLRVASTIASSTWATSSSARPTRSMVSIAPYQ